MKLKNAKKGDIISSSENANLAGLRHKQDSRPGCRRLYRFHVPHSVSQDGVHAGLIAFAALFQPCYNVGVQFADEPVPKREPTVRVSFGTGSWRKLLILFSFRGFSGRYNPYHIIARSIKLTNKILPLALPMAITRSSSSLWAAS
jgi:hypothetical protein